MIETDRLTLRRWRPTDAAPMSSINGDPAVMRWIGDGSVRTPDQTRSDIARWETEWQERGFGLFAVDERATGRMIGFVGLSVPTFFPEVLPAVEIGWRLSPSSWGKGLATEGARAVVAFAFDDRGLDRLVSVAQVGNEASERIMTKLGMRLAIRTNAPETGRPLHVYELHAPAAD